MTSIPSWSTPPRDTSTVMTPPASSGGNWGSTSRPGCGGTLLGEQGERQPYRSVQRGFLTRNPHPVEGCGRRRWPGLQRVVRDFERGSSEQAPARRHSTLRLLMALTCRDVYPAPPWPANPGEKTSLARKAARNLSPPRTRCGDF